MTTNNDEITLNYLLERMNELEEKINTINKKIYLYDNYSNIIFSNKAYYYAILNDDLELLKWLKIKSGSNIDIDYKDKIKYFNIAIKNNNLKMLKWMNQNNFDCDVSSFNEAIKNQNYEIIKWLHNINCPYNVSAFVEAIKIYDTQTENIELLELLYDIGCNLYVSVFNTAITKNNIKLLEWLLKKNCPYNILSTNIAIRQNNKEIINWIVSKGIFPFDETSFYHSIKTENIQMLNLTSQYVNINSTEIFIRILEQGNINLVNWFMFINPSYNINTNANIPQELNFALGSVEVYQYLYKSGYNLLDYNNTIYNCQNADIINFFIKINYNFDIFQVVLKNNLVILDCLKKSHLTNWNNIQNQINNEIQNDIKKNILFYNIKKKTKTWLLENDIDNVNNFT